MTDREKFSPPVVGGSSLLVIFAVLCLTVFALLGLSTVQADGRLSDSSVQAVTDYYNGDVQAERILAQLRSGQVPDGVVRNGSVYSYTCPVSEAQQLRVEVRLDGTSYTILKWQLVSIADWKPDESIDLWDGTES
jgi:hypothetical protein